MDDQKSKYDDAREHIRNAHAAMRKSFEALMPPGYVENRRKARKEILLAMRSLVDAAIEKIDKKAE